MDGPPDKFPVGLVTFAEAAEVLAQPSRDRRVVGEINRLTCGLGSTAMGDSILEALRLTGALPIEEEPRAAPGARSRRTDGEQLAAVLLLSDGANTSGEIRSSEAAGRARALGVPVYTRLLSAHREGVVEIPDDFGQSRLVRVPPITKL